MEQKKFKFINRIFSVMVLLTAAVTYLLTAYSQFLGLRRVHRLIL